MLSAAQMAQMSQLLDEALGLDLEGRRRWLEALPAEHRELEPALRRALLAEGDGASVSEESIALSKAAAVQTHSPGRGAQAGELVGPYRLIRPLGSGGMAEVWLAQRADGAFKREVALKLPMLSWLRKDLSSRFARERDILAGLEHPNIARLYDAGVSGEGLPYLAMEYVAGEPLTHWCNGHRLGIRERLKLFLQVLDAVQYAHGHHVIHRDIKPSNILVSESGQVRLLDFGVAKLLVDEERTELTQIYGRALTPEYASPELVRGEPIDAAADVYSLGVVLYELLSGSQPYRIRAGASIALLEQAIATAQVERPSAQVAAEAGADRSTTQDKLARRLKGDLDAIVLKALAKAPANRYASAAALADDLQRYLSGDPVEARPASAAYVIGKFVQRHRTGVATTAAFAVLAVAVIGYEVMRSPSAEHPAAANVVAPASLTATTAVSDKSIAVLPFVDMSEKHDQEYFSDGLSEELIDLLAKLPDLRVPARTSSFYFKGKSEDVASIAQKLRVAHVLEGSVRKAGDRLRVTAQLIRADNGYHLWSQTYDRNLKDVFQVQDEIAGAVIGALKVRLLPSKQVMSSRRTESTEAYMQYLLGQQFSNRDTLEDYRRAIKAYRKAIELDPKFAAAYAGLSYAEQWEAAGSDDDAGFGRAMASAEKAVALAPEEAKGYVERGLLRMRIAWDWGGAQADLQKALSLDPGDSRAQTDHAWLLDTLGRLSEAIASSRKATELDPLSVRSWWSLAYHLRDDGELAAAHEAIERALEISPDSVTGHYELGELQILEGKASEALATFGHVNAENFRLAGRSRAEHSLGHTRESQQALDELIARHAQGMAYQVAEVYAWRGEKEKAFEWLERAYHQRDTGLSLVKPDPFFARLHDDPRFGAFLRKMKLPES